MLLHMEHDIVIVIITFRICVHSTYGMLVLG